MATEQFIDPLGSLLKFRHLATSLNEEEYIKFIISFFQTLDRDQMLSLIFNSLLQTKNKQQINQINNIVSSILNERLKHKNQNEKQQTLQQSLPINLKLSDLPSNIIEYIASSLSSRDLINFEKVNRFFAYCCRTSNASKYLIDCNPDWFKNLIKLNYRYVDYENNSLYPQNNLIEFMQRWKNVYDLQLKLGRNKRRSSADGDEFVVKQHLPWCYDPYLHFIGDFLLKPLFASCTNLSILMKDHTDLALFDGINYEFPNLQKLTVRVTSLHDLTQFLSQYRFDNIQHYHFAKIYINDYIIPFNVSHSILDLEKDYSQDIRKFIDVLIPNYSAINEKMENKENDLLKIVYNEYECLSLEDCELETQILQYDNIFIEAFENTSVIKEAMKNLKKLCFKWNDVIYARLLSSILIALSENLTVLHIGGPISLYNIPDESNELKMKFTNLTELSMDLHNWRSLEVYPLDVYEYIIDHSCHLKEVEISLDSESVKLDKLSNICINNVDTLQCIKLNFGGDDDLKTKVIDLIIKAFQKLGTKQMNKCKLILSTMTSDHVLDSPNFRDKLIKLLKSMHKQCKHCVVIGEFGKLSTKAILPDLFEQHCEESQFDSTLTIFTKQHKR